MNKVTFLAVSIVSLCFSTQAFAKSDDLLVDLGSGSKSSQQQVQQPEQKMMGLS